jgi:hypothetical protein
MAMGWGEKRFLGSDRFSQSFQGTQEGEMTATNMPQEVLVAAGDSGQGPGWVLQSRKEPMTVFGWGRRGNVTPDSRGHGGISLGLDAKASGPGDRPCGDVLEW